MYKTVLIICLLVVSSTSLGQTVSNLRNKVFTITSDTTQIDSFSIINGTLSVQSIEGNLIDSSLYSINYERSELYSLNKLFNKTIKVSYRVFPVLFSKRYFTHNYSAYQKNVSETGFLINSSSNSNQDKINAFNFGKLDYNGNLTRGFGFGNAQSLSINSSLNLQLFGMITKDIEIKAAITDNNIPIQPDGNTAQLQEFDKIYIQLRYKEHYLNVGDFDLTNNNSYFMHFHRNLQGFSYHGRQEIKNAGAINGTASVAISRGKYVINRPTAQEGNQGPYKLVGSNGETFIIVLAGTERIYINGELLKRGANNDYVIDYNVGEVRFTPNKMITQDMRIRIEFEYADRYYLRSLYHANAGFEHSKFKVDFNIFSQQDAKNQPINQDLEDNQIHALQNAGDDIQRAYSSGVSKVEFDASRVLYERKDTFINGLIDTFYQYSTKNTPSLYSLVFSYVGQGNGDYTPVNAVANGRVYEYVGPNLGAYAPLIKLVPPQKQLMANSRIIYKISNNIATGIEGAISNKDINTFSKLDAKDNTGYGINWFYKQHHILKKDSLKSISLNANYEFKQKYFEFIERYRQVEFTRDWNTDENQKENEHLAQLKFSFNKQNIGTIQYQFSYFNQHKNYSGFEHTISGNSYWKGLETIGKIRYLHSTQNTSKIDFLRPELLVTYHIKKLAGFKVGATLKNEMNRIEQKQIQKLNPNSFLWQDYGIFLQSGDSAKYQLLFKYNYRQQHVAKTIRFDPAYLKAHNAEIQGQFMTKSKQRLTWNLKYRHLKQDTLKSAENELTNFYLGRIDYGLYIKKGLIKGTFLYEIGAGREQKTQYNYIEDPNGLGSYAWKDFNGNGVEELNEFYISSFSNENRYLRIYTNSVEYLPISNARFNASVSLNPKAIWFNTKGFKDILARFNNSTSLQFNNKVYAGKNISFGHIISPFNVNLNDTILVSDNTNIRNVLFFNRSSTTFGLDYTYQYSKSKNLLTSGFEKRTFIEHIFSARWNVYKSLTLNASYTNAFKQNNSDFYFDKQYEYISNSFESSLTWLFKQALRVSVGYEYGFKSNPMAIYGGQFTVSNGMYTKFKFSKPNNYSITSDFTYNTIAYSEGNYKNEPLRFDMLQGLQNGNNFIWKVGFEKSIAKILQLSLQYDGRKISESKSVHTGRMQVRAIF